MGFEPYQVLSFESKAQAIWMQEVARCFPAAWEQFRMVARLLDL